MEKWTSFINRRQMVFKMFSWTDKKYDVKTYFKTAWILYFIIISNLLLYIIIILVCNGVFMNYF